MPGSTIYRSLCAEKALIWRITHRRNLPWILSHGLYAANGTVRSDSWVAIGNKELIARRAHRQVPVPPNGVLNDYVPFYFTPFSPMLYNIHTGRGDVARVRNEDIVILVSSLHRVAQLDLPYVFTDRHAYTLAAHFHHNLAQLDVIDWASLQRRDFKRDPDDPEKVERYQAEALIYRHVPAQALGGIICSSRRVQAELQACVRDSGLALQVHCRPSWYF